MKKTILVFIVFISQINFAQNKFLETGNVGIGTTNPSVPLDVIGTVKIQSSNSYYNENLRLLPSLIGDYSSIALGAVSGNSGTGIGQWTIVRYPAAANYMFSLRYNSTDFFNITNNGNVGIGEPNPEVKLTLKDNDQVLNFLTNQRLDGMWPPITDLSTMTIQSSGLTSGNIAFATGNNEVMRIQRGGNVGIGTINPMNKLDVNGTIHSKEVKVDMNGWSDFVFKKEYNLPTLEQVEKHIAEKGHLENIPSEKEVLENGINLGEMNAKLLQKIEELTLYIIEMKKENLKIKNENDLMKKNQVQLENRILSLENR
ncbi:hypothetical protein AB9T89_00025 [Flavobacterium oncorhynchi]|uniref:hypothetical protein n=1 Tax=Flavobacterium oncorhynchi TaxID=728056 RepID=UPI00351A66EB